MKKNSAKKVVLVIVAGLLAAGVYFTVVIYSAWQNPLNAFVKSALSSNVEITKPSQTFVQSPEPSQNEPDDAFKQSHTINILLLGIDSNNQREEENMGWRSDMVMLCTINMQKNTIALTTIPRDTRTNVYHMDNAGKPVNMELHKINAAYSYGGGPDKYGAQNAMLAVKDFLSGASGKDISIDYYISTDLQSIPKLADSMGGIPLQLDADFPDLGKKGDMVLLSGSNVDKFLQNRHDVGGDIVRARHHAEFLLGMMKQFKTKGGLDYITVLLNYTAQYVHTNLSFEQDVALASLLDKCDIGALDYKAIGGESKYIGGISYYLPDMADVKNRMNALMQ